MRQMRTDRKLSQRQLAIKYGVLLGKEYGATASLVAGWESNSRKPTTDTIATIAEAIKATEAEHDVMLMSAGYLPIHGRTGLDATKECVSIPSDAKGAVVVALRAATDIPDEGKEYIHRFTELVVKNFKEGRDGSIDPLEMIAIMSPESEQFTQEMQEMVREMREAKGD